MQIRSAIRWRCMTVGEADSNEQKAGGGGRYMQSAASWRTGRASVGRSVDIRRESGNLARHGSTGRGHRRRLHGRLFRSVEPASGGPRLRHDVARRRCIDSVEHDTSDRHTRNRAVIAPAGSSSGSGDGWTARLCGRTGEPVTDVTVPQTNALCARCSAFGMWKVDTREDSCRQQRLDTLHSSVEHRRPIASVHWIKARNGDRLDWAVVDRTSDVASESVGLFVTRTFGHLSDQTNGDAQEDRSQMSQFHKLCPWCSTFGTWKIYARDDSKSATASWHLAIEVARLSSGRLAHTHSRARASTGRRPHGESSGLDDVVTTTPPVGPAALRLQWRPDREHRHPVDELQCTPGLQWQRKTSTSNAIYRHGNVSSFVTHDPHDPMTHGHYTISSKTWD